MRLHRNSDNHAPIVFFVCPRYKQGQECAGDCIILVCNEDAGICVYNAVVKITIRLCFLYVLVTNKDKRG